MPFTIGLHAMKVSIEDDEVKILAGLRKRDSRSDVAILSPREARLLDAIATRAAAAELRSLRRAVNAG